MTEPLTPADCDLRDFPRMMIDIPRLRGSGFDATLDDSAWRAGLNLWMTAWHQVPAASLPDDDAELAKAAGLGRDVRTWRKVKTAALRGWTKCSDGLLYHETVAEIALESWLEKLIQALSSGAGNKKRWGTEFDPSAIEGEIDRAAGMLASLNPKSKALKKLSRRKPSGASEPDAGGNPAGTYKPSQRDGKNIPTGSQETGNRQGEENPPKPPEGAFSPKSIEDGFEVAWTAYPEDGKATTNREFSLAAWRPAAAEIGPDRLAAAVRAFAASPVVTGPKAKTVPNFAAWLRNRRFETFLPAGGEAPAAGWAGPPDLWELAVRRRDEAWAKGYLRPVVIDGAQLLAATGTAAKAITEAIGDELAARGLTVVHARSAPPSMPEIAA